jgi:CRP/FNR family transcriptional regulator, nitrogen fixation regulation protein
MSTDQTGRLQTLGGLESTYEEGAEIYSEKQPARHMYQVKAGAVRTYRLLSDGRRQVAAFHLPGDIFGGCGETNRFTAEAVVETTLRRRSIGTVTQGDPAAVRNLFSITSKLLEHAENHVLLLGRKNALEKVAAFLLEMDTRLTAAGVITLPMSRRDIADYLGLTLESVSRALAQMRCAGVLELRGVNLREIEIRNRHQLARFDLEA